MKTDTTIHNIELRQVRDDIIRHKPVSIKMWNRPNELSYLAIEWEFTHMGITMFSRTRPTVEVEQMLRDAKAWSMTLQRSSNNIHFAEGEEYVLGGEEE